MVKTVDRLESDIPMSAGEGALMVLAVSALFGVGYLVAWGRGTIRSMISDRELRAQNPQSPREYGDRNGQQTRGGQGQNSRTPRPNNRGSGPGPNRRT